MKKDRSVRSLLSIQKEEKSGDEPAHAYIDCI